MFVLHVQTNYCGESRTSRKPCCCKHEYSSTKGLSAGNEGLKVEKLASERKVEWKKQIKKVIRRGRMSNQRGNQNGKEGRIDGRKAILD